MAVWRFIPGDQYDLDFLLGLSDFFEKMVLVKTSEVNSAKELEKYGLPGWRTEMVRRQVGLEEAIDSLEQVKIALQAMIKKNDS